jgi:hypothetical protein
VNDCDDEGGGPAGVVDGSLPNAKPPPREFLFGVKGPLLVESPKSNRPDMAKDGGSLEPDSLLRFWFA